MLSILILAVNPADADIGALRAKWNAEKKAMKKKYIAKIEMLEKRNAVNTLASRKVRSKRRREGRLISKICGLFSRKTYLTLTR